MRVRVVTIAPFMLLTFPVCPARAQDLPRRILVTREGGPRIELGSIHGYDEVRYQVCCRNDRTSSHNTEGRIGIEFVQRVCARHAAGKDEAIFRGDLGGTKAKVPVSKAGEYLIQVFLMRNAARRGSTSRYTLSVELTK